MKDYKKSFIRLTLMLTGAVLLVMNTIIFVYFYHTSIEELKTTMEQKLEPYDALRNLLPERPPAGTKSDAPSDTTTPDPAPLPDGTETGNTDNADDPDSSNRPDTPISPNNADSAASDAAPDQTGRKPGGPNPNAPNASANKNDSSEKLSGSVFVFFYNPEREQVLIISKDELQNSEELLDTAEKIYAEKEDFGILKSEDLYYYKQTTPHEIKIAIADRNFIRFAMLELSGVLALIFVCAMLLFYLISRKLSERAAKPLEEAIAREKQFITDASHDLKTPLTVILSNADILNKNPQSTVSEMQKWIDGTRQAAFGMKTLIEQMLVLSESETAASGEQAARQDIDFSDIVMQNALVLESVAYEKNIAYRTDIQPQIHIKGVESYVRRIVSSLIDNALKYEKAGGSVQIRLYRAGANVCFSVTNQPTVISEKDLPHIFERFYRSDKSRHNADSHGLGLAIVKNFTELMGGKISAISNEKDGTCFCVTFPAK